MHDNARQSSCSSLLNQESEGLKVRARNRACLEIKTKHDIAQDMHRLLLHHEVRHKFLKKACEFDITRTQYSCAVLRLGHHLLF